jgi:CysZ protein
MITVLLLIGGAVTIHKLSDYLQEVITRAIELDDNGEGAMGWLEGSLSFVIGIGLHIIFWFIFMWLQKYIMLIILSPILALLSERVDEIITGKKYPFDISQFVVDVFRGIGIALRNMFIEFGFILLCLMISWIPVIGWITAIFLYIVSCYFYGFSMIDYTSERRRLSIGKSIAFIRSNKGFAISNGFLYSIMTMIPYVGNMFAPIVSVVAATLGTYEVLEQDKRTGRAV